MSPQTRVQAPGRTVFFLTEFQINGMLEALRSELVDRVRSFRSMEGSVSGDSLGNYRLSLSVELSDEEGDRLVHQLAGLDSVESPDWAETPHLWKRVQSQVRSMRITRTCRIVVLEVFFIKDNTK